MLEASKFSATLHNSKMDDSISFGRDVNWYRAPKKSGRKTANATWQTVVFLCWHLTCLLFPKVPSQAERFPIIVQSPKWGGLDQLWWGNPDSQGYWAHIATSGALNRYKELRWYKPSPYEGRMIAALGVLVLPQWSWSMWTGTEWVQVLLLLPTFLGSFSLGKINHTNCEGA